MSLYIVSDPSYLLLPCLKCFRECITTTLSDGCCPECGLPGWVKNLSPNYQLAGLISHLNSLKELLGLSSSPSSLCVSSPSTKGESPTTQYSLLFIMIQCCSLVSLYNKVPTLLVLIIQIAYLINLVSLCNKSPTLLALIIQMAYCLHELF